MVGKNHLNSLTSFHLQLHSLLCQVAQNTCTANTDLKKKSTHLSGYFYQKHNEHNRPLCKRQKAHGTGPPAPFSQWDLLSKRTHGPAGLFLGLEKELLCYPQSSHHQPPTLLHDRMRPQGMLLLPPLAVKPDISLMYVWSRCRQHLPSHQLLSHYL